MVGPALHASCGHCREECARPGIICLSPLPELQRRRPCGYDIVTIANCNGAVTRVAMALSPPSAGVIALVTMALSPTPRWYWVAWHCPRRECTMAHVAKASWPTLMPFTFALARLSSASRLCCAGGVNCSGARCIVARDVIVPLPTLHWRRPVSCVVLIAKGLAGRCSDLAAVASRSHRRQPAATALPPLQPATLSQSRHRCIAVAPLWP
jgi:hypothetical protein